MSLLSTANAKTIKGEKIGYITYILYLQPHKSNDLGKNLCPSASLGCIKACLNTAGRGRFKNVKTGRKRKTDLFLADKGLFMSELYFEIGMLVHKHNKKGEKICIRLNGTSDIVFENIIVPETGKNIFDSLPYVQFYDYTKIVSRLRKQIPANYDLTFSRSESNDPYLKAVTDLGFNVAVVFSNKNVPSLYNGIPVVNGDETDLRFLDKKGGFIVGLYAKGKAKKDLSGFVVLN
jgi:hypothetical protein